MNSLLTAITLTVFGLTIATPSVQADSTQLSVISESGQPIIGADVLIGPKEGTPFINNRLKTDLNGKVDIPPEWITNQPVTISAGGYLAATYLNVAPTDEIFQMHREDAKVSYEVKGQTTNYDSLRKDGKIDFSLVYPALHESQLIQFDVGSVINPDVDILSVFTDNVPVPSNISIPKQKENYILPITLDKPIYRMSFKQTGNYRMTALHGQFPLKQVVGDIRDGKAFYDVINYFRILGGGQRDLVVNSSIEEQDIPVDQMNFDKKILVRGPPQINPEHIMFSIALARSGGLYYTTDIKKINPDDSTELTAPSQVDGTSIISILMNKADIDLTSKAMKDVPLMPNSSFKSLEFKSLETISTELLNIFKLTTDDDTNILTNDNDILALRPGYNDGPGGVSTVHQLESQSAPVFLNLVSRPVFDQNMLKLSFTSPNTTSDIEPVATYILLSEIERRTVNKYTIENKIRIWELTQLGWVNDVTLPQMPQNLAPGKNYRWEVLFLGRQKGHNEMSSGEYFLNDITHVSRNSFDF